MRCANCGHTAEQHEHVPGVEFTGVFVVNEDGSRSFGLPDVWVCAGGRESDSDDPWDHVCGCVLHAPPLGVVT